LRRLFCSHFLCRIIKRGKIIEEQSVQQFLDALAGNNATPGGGSAAAINGAMGAALVSMVCNLTIGKKKYADVDAEMRAILGRAEELRGTLTHLVTADAEAFDKVMDAFGLPRQTDEEKTARAGAIQDATKEAALVPLAVARACVEVIALGKPVAEKGNVNAASDAGVAVLLARAGLKGAALNVLINLGSLKDKTFAAEKEAELNGILAGQDALTEEVYQQVKSRVWG
jgi:formiminotetrahydrofolate cyclodeaminase